MGFPILEALPSRKVPYEQVDPFILVHEGRLRLSDITRRRHQASPPRVRQPLVCDRRLGQHRPQHRTGRRDGAGTLSEGALLALRTGRGAWHAEAIGADELEEGHADTEFRGVLFWVNLARKDKQIEPSAQILQPEQIPVRQEGDAIGPDTGRRELARSSGHSGAHPRRRAARRRRTSRQPSRPSSRASPTCWTARPRSVPTGDRRSRLSSFSSVGVMSSGSPMPPTALGTSS